MLVAIFMVCLVILALNAAILAVVTTVPITRRPSVTPETDGESFLLSATGVAKSPIAASNDDEDEDLTELIV